MLSIRRTLIISTITLVSILLACGYLPDIIDGIFMPQAPPPEKSSGRPRQWGSHKEFGNNCSAADEVCTSDVSKPWNLRVEDDTLSDLQDRLRRWKRPGAPIKHEDPWSDGISSEFMSKLVQKWTNSYDWRKYEAKLNAIGLRETVVDGLLIRMHYIKRGDGTKAILLLHGWPGSIWEFHRFIELILSEKSLENFSIVCPSLPGYGFSSAPEVEGYNPLAMAGTIQRLMKKLGYKRYIIHGGDWGSFVAQSAAYLDPSPLIGLHLNFFPAPPTFGSFLVDELKIRFVDDEGSKQRASKSKHFGEVAMMTGYFHQQATKPETLSFGLSDSPVGLCAWVSEKFQSWSDPSLPIEDKFDVEDIITNCMIYWVTNSIASSMRLYKEVFRTTEANAVGSLKVTVPVALSLFPHEIFPAADSPIKRKYTDIVLFRKHEKGGHFAALEQPSLLVKDLVEFVALTL